MSNTENSNQALQVLKETELCGRQFAVYGTAENPLFKAADVAAMIEHTDVSTMARSVDEDERLIQTLFVAGQRRECLMLTEDGLYEVLMQSRKPIAKEFKRGVKTILKEIRTNGGYMAAREGETEQELLSRAVLMAKATIDRQQQQLQETKQQLSIVSEINEQQERQLTEQAPKVLFADAVSASKDCILIGDLAKVLTQNGYPIGQNRLFEELRVRGFLCSRDGYRNQPAQRYQEMGLFEIKYGNHQNPDGTSLITRTTKVTSKGLVYFVNYFLNIKKSA